MKTIKVIEEWYNGYPDKEIILCVNEEDYMLAGELIEEAIENYNSLVNDGEAGKWNNLEEYLYWYLEDNNIKPYHLQCNTTIYA